MESLFPDARPEFIYFKPLRLELYQGIISFIKRWGGEKVLLYFWMENEEIWRQAMGWVPRKKKTLETYLSLPLR